MQVMRDKQNRKGKTFLKVLGILVLISGISLGGAFLWQQMQELEVPPETPPEGIPASLEEDEPIEQRLEEEPEIENGEQTEEPPSDPDDLPEEDETDLGEENPLAKRPPVPGSVPLAKRVDNSYFNDAIFFGDSLSVGIPLYQVAGNPDTVAFTGINPDNINYSPVIATSEGNKTILEAAQQYGSKNKVYIMLGGNGLWMDEATFRSGYQTFLDSVKAQYPGATIYLQSILPVTHQAYLNYETAHNDTIERFNEIVQDIARQNGVLYLDVAHALMDETGALPLEASPLDGMHLTPEYYNKWFEYLKTHTVEEKKK